MRKPDFVGREKVYYRMEVTVHCKEGIKPLRSHVADYVRRAVENWIGGGDPEDPLYDGIENVTVKVKEMATRQR